MINGQEKYVTMGLRCLKQLTTGSAWYILRRNFPTGITDYIKSN